MPLFIRKGEVGKKELKIKITICKKSCKICKVFGANIWKKRDLNKFEQYINICNGK